jgi:hypothetical protein
MIPAPSIRLMPLRANDLRRLDANIAGRNRQNP